MDASWLILARHLSLQNIVLDVKRSFKMKKLELKLTKISEKALAVEIVYQSEELRNNREKVSVSRALDIFSDGNFSIVSNSSPALYSETLYVRGRISEKDKDVAFCNFDSSKERDDMYDFLVMAQKEINKPPEKHVELFNWILKCNETGKVFEEKSSFVDLEKYIVLSKSAPIILAL